MYFFPGLLLFSYIEINMAFWITILQVNSIKYSNTLP